MQTLLFAIIVALAHLLLSQSATAALCPDGTFVAGNRCRLAPNGKFISGDSPMRMAPDGSYTSGAPRLTPKGNYIGEPARPKADPGRRPRPPVQRLCPDGTHAYGSCRLQPNGKYVGE